MKKQSTTDAKRVAANDKPENGKAGESEGDHFAEDRPTRTRAVHDRLD